MSDLDPHPPTRQCNCPKCLASFDDTALDPENVDAVVACLGDDAAMLRDAHPETADTMEAAAALIERLYANRAQPRELEFVDLLPAAEQAALDKIHKAMARKLYAKSQEGTRGFETASAQYLSHLLRTHVDKGDPVDVANFCAFLLHNGDRIQQVEPWPRGNPWALAVDTAMVGMALDCTTPDSDPIACVALLMKHCEDIGAYTVTAAMGPKPYLDEPGTLDLLQRQPPKGWGVYRAPEAPSEILISKPDGTGVRLVRKPGQDDVLYELAEAMLPPPAPEIQL